MDWQKARGIEIRGWMDCIGIFSEGIREPSPTAEAGLEIQCGIINLKCSSQTEVV